MRRQDTSFRNRNIHNRPNHISRDVNFSSRVNATSSGGDSGGRSTTIRKLVDYFGVITVPGTICGIRNV